MPNLNDNLPDCCKPTAQPENRKGLLWGIIYGVVPHTFCILFVLFSIVGATSGAVFMKKFLFVPHLFQYLLLLSFAFAMASAVFYLRKNGLFSLAGIAKKWRYLSIMFATTVIINLAFVYWILPSAANLNSSEAKSGQTLAPTNDGSNINGLQIIKMDQVGSGYRPSNFTLKKGIPVKWIITSKSQSCAASIYSKALGINKTLEPGENIIEFTPTKTGKFSFSCFMGMYSGTIDIKD